MDHPLNITQFARHVGVTQQTAATWVASGYITATALNPRNPSSEKLIEVDEMRRVIELINFARALNIKPATVLGIAHALQTGQFTQAVLDAFRPDAQRLPDNNGDDGTDDGNNGHTTDHPKVA